MPSRVEKILTRIKLQFDFHIGREGWKHYDSVEQPLVLITQIQRSGGTLLSQLFDGHEAFLAYPSELNLWDTKWLWNELRPGVVRGKRLYNRLLRHYILNCRYEKESAKEWDKTYKFFFSNVCQQKIFQHSLKSQSADERGVLNSYFSSFFNGWLNYRGNIPGKKYVTAFTPRVNMHRQSIDYFNETYPDGRILTIVRDPMTWLASAKKHSEKYQSTAEAISLWMESTRSSCELAERDKRVTVVMFERLVNDTEQQMKIISGILDIDYDEQLSVPTFNGESVMSDSSFKPVDGKIDSTVTKRKLDNSVGSEIENSTELQALVAEAASLYERACALAI